MVGVPPVLRIHGEIIVANGDPLTPADTERLILDSLTEEKKQALAEDLAVVLLNEDTGSRVFQSEHLPRAGRAGGLRARGDDADLQP